VAERALLFWDGCETPRVCERATVAFDIANVLFDAHKQLRWILLSVGRLTSRRCGLWVFQSRGCVKCAISRNPVDAHERVKWFIQSADATLSSSLHRVLFYFRLPKFLHLRIVALLFHPCTACPIWDFETFTAVRDRSSRGKKR
jgi:hypothetical protein